MTRTNPGKAHAYLGARRGGQLDLNNARRDKNMTTAQTPPNQSGAVQISCPCGLTHTFEISAPKRNDDEQFYDSHNNPFGSEWSFRRLIRAGAFPAFKGPRNRLLAKRSDVLAYLESQQVTPVRPAVGELDLNDDGCRSCTDW